MVGDGVVEEGGGVADAACDDEGFGERGVVFEGGEDGGGEGGGGRSRLGRG